MKNFTQQNYTTASGSYQLVLPLQIEILIPKDDSVRLLSQLMEELDYSELYKAYSPKGRNSAVSPKTLFKLVVYGYMNQIYTSRELERACRRDINFMWLLEGAKAPDHNTFARFRSEKLPNVAEHLFYQLVQMLKQHNELAGKTLFVDGTKLEANANRYSFVWKKSILKHHESLKTKIAQALPEIIKTFQLTTSAASLDVVLTELYAKKERENVTFVSGTGKRKSPLQKAIETLRNYEQRQQKYQHYEALMGNRNSFSKTDIDATFMRMKDDHMKNGQLKPGYNIQIGVEAEYIVGIDVSAERADAMRLIPLLKSIHSHTPGVDYTNIVADAGYESEENYQHLQTEKKVSYIKPNNYERSKKAKYYQNPYVRENMKYDEELDAYTCPNNKQIQPVGTKIRKTKSGYESEVTVYECEDCHNCSHKSQCTKAKGNRRLEVSKTFQCLREESQRSITTEEGILLRINRSIQVEGAFGVLKEDYRFRRFLLRGKAKVTTECFLLAIGYNVNKYHNKRQTGRQGMQLHAKIKVA